MIKSILRAASMLIAVNGKQSQGNTTKSCKALAMSGGGAKGSFEAGALWGLVMNDPDKTKYEYDVVTGVSAGAINTGAVSLFKKGDEVNMVQFLSDTWAGVADGDIYKQWSPLGILTGLLEESGVLNDNPGFEFLKSIFEQFSYEIQRKIAISCVDVVTGSYHVFNETTTDAPKAVISSASIPFIFPHQVWPNNVVCMDGGTVWNTNLASAIQRCEEQVDDHSQITVDVIICQDYQFSSWTDQNNAVSSFQRFTDIQSHYRDIGDVYDLMQLFPDVNYRYYIQPSQPMPGQLQMLNFDNTTNTWPMQMLGRLDGENAIKDGEGFMFSKMTEWSKSQELQKEYPRVHDYVVKVVKERAEVHRQERRHQDPEEETDYEEEYNQMKNAYIV